MGGEQTQRAEANLRAMATTSAVWPEKCRWGRATLGTWAAEAVDGSTMTVGGHRRNSGVNIQGAGRRMTPMVR